MDAGIPWQKLNMSLTEITASLSGGASLRAHVENPTVAKSDDVNG
jgi:hypothetical protein